MKTKLNSVIRSNCQGWFQPALFTTALLAVGALLGQNARAQTFDSWSGGSGAGTAWTATSNWTGGVIPTNSTAALFNVTMTGSPLTINPSPGTNLEVGSISVGTSESETVNIRNLSTAAPGAFQLYGVGGILLSNVSTAHLLSFQNTTVNNTNFLNVEIMNSGIIYAANGDNTTPPTDGGGGEIEFLNQVFGSGSITNAGPGILYMLGTNTFFLTNMTGTNVFTGNYYLNAGTLEVGPAALLGSGTIYFQGGNMESGGNRGSLAVSNPIVVNTPGNAYIYSLVASSGTVSTNSLRVFPLAGSLSGTNGTLVIANPTTAAYEIFLVPMLGAFTFNLPMVVGDNLSDAYNDDTPNNSYGALELANTINTVQTFNGNISGDGFIIRGNVAGGVIAGQSFSFANDTGSTIFTGNNTYTGGTTINNGTLFANNTSGSALGTGAVTVTNGGILAGNGSVGAATSIYLNGTIQPGSTSSNIGNLSFSSGLTFYPGAEYIWQISSVSGSAGTAWDLISAGAGWTDAGNSSTPITIYVNSEGLTPTGWNDATSYSWMIIANNGSGTGFNANNWAVNISGFSGPVAGVFSVTNDVHGDVLLTYTPSSGNILINVASGSVTQGAVTPTNYPILTGLYSVTKVGNGEVIMTNSLNSYQGTTYIDAGTASAAVNATTSGGAFGASSTLVLGNTNGNSNATLNIDVAGVTVANAVTVQSGSSGVKTIGTTITSGGATNSGAVTLQDNVTLSVASGGSDLFSGNFSGTGGITFTGGIITMSGLGSYSGTSTLTGGTLNLNSSALGSNTFTISGASTLDNTSGANVTLGNNPPQNWNADFSFAGTSNLNLGTGPVTLGATRTVTISNNILTVGGTIAGTGFGLTLVGPGQLALAAATTNSYTGGTTNQGGILAINGTTTFGDGTGTLTFSGGGNLLNTGSRLTFPIANPVQINTTTRFYGNSTDVASPDRYLPFTGGFTVTGGSSIYIDNVGSATTVFNLTLQGGNFTTINWPIVIGDPTFDTPGALTTLNLINDDTTPVQTISSLITGTGSIVRGANTVNTGGTTILTAQNTFTNGVSLTSGAIGLGASSITNGSGVVSGPLGTGLFTLGASTAETNLTLFASAGPVEIDNNLFFDGDTNMTFTGVYNMLFTGALNSGGVAKTISVTNGITTTFSGPITNTGSSTGGALTKTGGGILVFNGSNTYAGTTTVDAGTLLVNGSLSTNTVMVSGGTLGGTGAIAGSVTFASGAQAYLYKTNGSPDSPLAVSGSLTLSNNTVIVDLGGMTTLSTGTYTLLTYAGTLSGSFNSTPTFVDGSLAAGKTATIDLSTTNEVNLVVTTSSYTPPNFSPDGVSHLGNGTVSVSATGVLGTPYRLWATTNVALTPVTNTWTLISSNTISASPFTNLDLNATNFPRRFYLFTAP